MIEPHTKTATKKEKEIKYLGMICLEKKLNSKVSWIKQENLFYYYLCMTIIFME